MQIKACVSVLCTLSPTGSITLSQFCILTLSTAIWPFSSHGMLLIADDVQVTFMNFLVKKFVLIHLFRAVLRWLILLPFLFASVYMAFSPFGTLCCLSKACGIWHACLLETSGSPVFSALSDGFVLVQCFSHYLLASAA